MHDGIHRLAKRLIQGSWLQEIGFNETAPANGLPVASAEIVQYGDFVARSGKRVGGMGSYIAAAATNQDMHEPIGKLINPGILTFGCGGMRALDCAGPVNW
ncbi:hypothetical protein GCM10027431_18500 [Lysobacter rhizosphaerae]